MKKPSVSDITCSTHSDSCAGAGRSDDPFDGIQSSPQSKGRTTRLVVMDASRRSQAWKRT